MKYNVAWLNELAGTNYTAQEMAELFTRHSFEVEGIEEGVEIPKGVVVGKILEVSPHPDADKLQITHVAVDSGEKEVLEIVCGASNIAVGDVVPVATVGTVLPNGVKIKKSKIRGVESFGMLCAEDELGLGGDHGGILHISETAEIGSPVSNVLSSDAIIELDILASRGHDALSHVGIARELRAVATSPQMRGGAEPASWRGRWGADKKTLRFPESDEEDRDAEIKISIENPDLCHRYMGVLLENLDNTRETPEWMKRRLEACGINSINLVTDVTNYVLLEYGQPMHAFDRERITDNEKEINGEELKVIQIHVRKAHNGERLALLDGQEVELNQDDIVIANDTQALALAGVMGGLESATSKNTTSVLLEGAWFDPVSIRKTRMRHKIMTESSHRFERNPDENGVEGAMARAVELLKEFAGCKVVSVVDEYPRKNEKRDVVFSPVVCERLLGVTLERDRMREIFALLGCDVVNGDEQWSVTVPTFRKDLTTQEDLIEEIGRMIGYDHVEATPLVSIVQPAKTPERYAMEREMRETVRAVGFDEVLTYSFYGDNTIELFSLDRDVHFSIANPLNPDQKYFRTRILPNTLEVVATNIKTFEDVRMYEFGNVYERGEDGSVEESRRLALVWSSRTKKDIFSVIREMKGIVESIVRNVTGEMPESTNLDDIENTEMFHPTQSMDIAVGGVLVAFMGTVHPFIARRLKLPPSTVIASLNVDTLLWLRKEDTRYTPLERFPRVVRDISLFIPNEASARSIEKRMRENGGESLLECELFDVFEKEGRRSLAYRLSFGMPDRTLSGEEVETALGGIIEALKELGVEMKR